MTRQVTSPDAPVPGGPYSHAVIAGGLMFLSGQRPVDPRTGEIPDDIVDQARQVLHNLMAVLAAEGLGSNNVAKVTIYLDDIADFDQVNSVYREFFSDPYPARTTVAASLRGILVEIDAVAEVE